MKKMMSILTFTLLLFTNISVTQAYENYEDYSIGNSQSPIKMTIFHDFQCPFCARFHDTITKSSEIENYLSTNQLQITYRDYPLSFHKNALQAAQAANAVLRIDADQYIDFMDRLYHRQDQWASLSEPLSTFINYAEEVGIESTLFKKYYQDSTNIAEINADQKDGDRVGVTGTPSYFINGSLYSGAQPLNQVLEQIKNALHDKQPFLPEPPAGYEDEVYVGETFETNPFSDTDLSTLEGKAAAELFYRAIIGGFPDGEFKGQRPVNRAEAAKFLLLAKNIDVPERNTGNLFKDVLLGEWYAKYVIKASEKGIINGFADGSFRPAEGVQRDQFLAMLFRTFDLPTGLHLPTEFADKNEDPDGWYWAYAGLAELYNLFPGNERLHPAQKMTRNEIAVALYQYFKNAGIFRNPKSVVNNYLHSTLAGLTGADYDLQEAKRYLAPELREKLTDSFIPRSYGFQDGPSKVEIYDADTSDYGATVWVRDISGTSPQAWIFELDEEDGIWLITDYYPLTDETVL